MGSIPSALERAAARNLVTQYLRVQPGENAVVEGWSHTLSMSSATVDAIRTAGGNALLAYEDDDAWWRAVDRKQARPLGRLSDPEWAAVAAADVYVQFWGPADSARLEQLGDRRLDEWADGWFERWYKLARSTGLRGGRVATGWVTDSRVRRWGIDERRWRDALLTGCLADPEEMSKSGRRLARAFAGGRKVRITHANGTDLELALSGAPPRVYDGFPHPRNKAYNEYDLMANFPEGSFKIPLDGKTAEGRIVSNRRTYDEVWFPWETYSGGEFDFSRGRLASYSFEEGQAAFTRKYRRGTPGKDRAGSLYIGLNPKLKDASYLEYRELGSLQLNLGANSYLGGTNPSDFRGSIGLAGSEIRVDGAPVVRSGKIL